MALLKSPGKFEMKDEETLLDLLIMLEDFPKMLLRNQLNLLE